MVSSLRDQVTRIGWEWEDYLRLQGQTEDELREEWREQAEKRLERNLVLGHFVQAEKITLEDERLEEALEERLEGFEDEELRAQMRDYWLGEHGFPALSSEILMDFKNRFANAKTRIQTFTAEAGWELDTGNFFSLDKISIDISEYELIKLEGGQRIINDYEVILEPDEDVAQWWAGAPSVLLTDDGTFYLAARMREGRSPRGRRGYEIRILQSADGRHFEPINHILREAAGVPVFERPALLRDPQTGRFKLYGCSVVVSAVAFRVDFHYTCVNPSLGVKIICKGGSVQQFVQLKLSRI